jgi:hypothetical protein
MQITVTNPIIKYADDSGLWSATIEHRPVTASDRAAWNIPTAQLSMTSNHILEARDTAGGGTSEDTEVYASTQGDWKITFAIEDDKAIGWSLVAVVGWEFGCGYNLETLIPLVEVAKSSLQAKEYEWTNALAPLDMLVAFLADVMEDIDDRKIHWTTLGEG